MASYLVYFYQSDVTPVCTGENLHINIFAFCITRIIYANISVPPVHDDIADAPFQQEALYATRLYILGFINCRMVPLVSWLLVILQSLVCQRLLRDLELHCNTVPTYCLDGYKKNCFTIPFICKQI